MADKEKRDWRMYYEKNKEAASKSRMKYAKTHETQIKFVLNNENDKDIIGWLNKLPNRSKYLKDLIRKDIEREINLRIYGTPDRPVQKAPVADWPQEDDDCLLYSNTPDDDT